MVTTQKADRFTPIRQSAAMSTSQQESEHEAIPGDGSAFCVEAGYPGYKNPEYKCGGNRKRR